MNGAFHGALAGIALGFCVLMVAVHYLSPPYDNDFWLGFWWAWAMTNGSAAAITLVIFAKS